MLNIIKIILFVLVNVAGFYTTSVAAGGAMKLGVFPQLPVGPHLEYFKLMYFGGGSWIWIAAALISVGYFFARDELKNWLLLAPMYVTAIYCTVVLVYFNFFYTIT